ncbi:sodium:solute symporter [Phascolarctobacterium succinatutens]|uniref:sodium:solute symporter family protein n=1 Tax=Phascolarctobacterium succinatutens TaxID=626940 RepID=UPI0026F2D2CE|nr:sodium:solute symporter family protein [Phascolarctobacterium succinatutens]
MQLTSTHFFSLIITLLVTMLPGILAARRVKSAEDYNVGGRSAGAGMVAGTIIGTIVGGAATVGTAQLGFKLGLTAWWFTLGSGIALMLMAIFYSVPLRRSGLTTIAEFLVTNYGKPAGWLATLSACAGIFFSIVASTLTALHLVAGIFNVSLTLAAGVIILVTAALVFFGGLSSSGMAGIFKIMLIFASIFVGGFLAYSDMGGYTGIRAVFPEQPWFSLFGRGFGDGLFSLGAMIVGVISTQTYVQAIFSARNGKAAAAGCLSAALVVIPVGLPSVMIGMFMHVQHPEINSIDALPLYLATYLPEWLGGIGLAAVLLSALGSIAGLALGVGTMISRDVVTKVWTGLTAQGQLWASRLSVLAVSVAAMVFVFLHLDSSVLEWNYLSMALRGSGIFLPLTFCIFFPGRVRASMGVAAMGAGIFAALFWQHISSIEVNSLLPALCYNLFFLIIGLFWKER